MRCKNWFLSGCTLLATIGATPALAQKSDAEPQAGEVSGEGDIIVTARRRQETAQETPVALTVLNDALLDRYGVKGVASIQSLTPGLYTGESSGAMGGTISLRGIGSGDSMAFIDQAVSSNVDGVPISSAQILRAAQLDLKQIEVLRGPQALFFGKNSPGGIISLTTADPGERMEAMLRGGYEFTAREKYVEGMFSTPLSDTVGLRLAARYSDMDGYMKIDTPTGPGTIPMDISRFPDQKELFFRGTLTWKPSDRVSVRLKATFTDTDMIGGSSNFSDITGCPYGTPQRPGETPANCRNDGHILISQILPSTMAVSPLFKNPNGSRTNNQTLLSGQLDWNVTDTLKLTSVTGYYRITEDLTSNGGYGPYSNNVFAVGFSSDQVTQELRLASSFDGPINFLAGGFYEDRKLFTSTIIVQPFVATLSPALPATPVPANTRLPIESTHQKQESYSGFGQLILDATDQIQLTAGARYTHEVKNLLDYTVAQTSAGVYLPGVDVTKLPDYRGGPNPRLSYNDFSPEITVTWKPATDIMLFASYKEGFKSGGFDAGYTGGAIFASPTATAAQVAAASARRAQGQIFLPEHVKGGELGLKSRFANRQVTFNLTGYWYDYKGFQVSVFDTISRAFRLQNAGSARVRGIEAELRYSPNAIPGLSLHATGAFNDAKYRKFDNADCYNGQTFALGCNLVQNTATGIYTAQNLSGQRLRKAPEFAATFGGYYETLVTNGLMMGLSVDGSYSGAYEYGTNYQPLAYQSAYAKLDATLRFFSEDKRWEFAVIGRNLTDKRNLINGIDRTGTGSGKGTTQTSCTAAFQAGCAALSDIIGTPTLPRTIALQATVRY
ncbi:TonB-dependent receptor [Novosphingobium sp. G106]|uniref:TonB-dependent receptor n=1 Tax=Novosphingobium sp. G106 TaxID=2849500 RepID=UPI001C2D293F|nr:TonB-dependent receptor [Novosphingobium sp. G106]MBV1690525.1 TonB-dependent receptor [Novosphingobium sp. G106]